MKDKSLNKRHLISITDLSKDDILHILDSSKRIKRSPAKKILKDKILISCFFEPSTRTRLSFESAMLRLGGKAIGFSDANSTSTKKGETLSDSIKVLSSYGDVLVIRHPMDGAANLAAKVSSVPVINAGDGANQHPSQTLLDLFTIEESQGNLENLQLAIVGDLKYGRAAHSLALACAYFNMHLFFVSPEQLTMPNHILQELRKKNVKFSLHQSIEKVLKQVDILYMVRLQKERLTEAEHEQLGNQFILKQELLHSAKKNLKILHPLPRLQEIDTSVDATPFAHYFQQAANGVYVRQALLIDLLRHSSSGSHDLY